MLADWRAQGPVLGNVQCDVRCISCGYNLRALSVEGCCPECGCSVRASLKVRLVHITAEELSRIRRGLVVFLTGLSMVCGFALCGPAVAETVRYMRMPGIDVIGVLVQCGILLGYLIAALGVVHVTTRGDPPGWGAGTLARVAALAWIPLVAVEFVYEVTQQTEVYGLQVGATCALSLLSMALSWRLSRIALAAHCDSLYREFRKAPIGILAVNAGFFTLSHVGKAKGVMGPGSITRIINAVLIIAVVVLVGRLAWRLHWVVSERDGVGSSEGPIESGDGHE